MQDQRKMLGIQIKSLIKAHSLSGQYCPSVPDLFRHNFNFTLVTRAPLTCSITEHLVTRAPLTCSITLVTPAPLTCSITHLGHYPPISCSCRWWTSCFGQQFGEELQPGLHTAVGTCTRCLGRATTPPVLLACGSS